MVQLINVVVVEDDEGLRKLLRLVLGRTATFNVVGEAEDGQQGIARVAEFHPDLVLLDIKMPVMTGIEALPEIRRASPESVVVILSMFQDERIRAEAMRLGARAYLDKGMDDQDLVRRLQEIMGVPVEAGVGDRSRAEGSTQPSRRATASQARQRVAPSQDRSTSEKWPTDPAHP